MTHTTRLLLGVALAVLLLAAACGTQPGGVPTSTQEETAAPGATDTPSGITEAPITPAVGVATATNTPGMAGSPAATPLEIWGQYCARELPITVAAIPENASFEVVQSSGATLSPDNPIVCQSLGTFQDRQIVVCRGPGSAVATLNVCEGTACTQQQVGFETCPLFPGGRPSDTPAVTLTPTSSTLPTETPTP